MNSRNYETTPILLNAGGKARLLPHAPLAHDRRPFPETPVGADRCQEADSPDSRYAPPAQVGGRGSGEKSVAGYSENFPPHCFASSSLELLLRLAVLGLVLLCMALNGRACSPYFPNYLLEGGDRALLVAPTANFRRELARLQLVTSRFDHLSATNGYQQQTFDAEMSDLAAALKRGKITGVAAARIQAGHFLNRKKLDQFVDATERAERSPGPDGDPDSSAQLPLVMPVFDEVPGLPAEFADYFEGAVAYKSPEDRTETARAAWKRLLARPAAERKFKSTWAAYMLGRSWEDEDDDQAREYYRQVRTLARQGFADSTGLAAASLGREARIHYGRGEYQQAIALYLEQLAAGDDRAVQSLQTTAAAALDAPESLPQLALDAKARQVITAYLVSCGDSLWEDVEEAEGLSGRAVTAWLHAIAAAKVKDVELAEKLALAAYQGGAFEEAQGWIKRSANSPLAQWLQAKLWLRQGKVSQAAPLLAKVSRLFPLESSGTNAPVRFTDNLDMAYDSEYAGVPIGKQALAEWGAVQLGRRQYVEALDALLRAGFWPDAAYVAEDVLTAGELKTYVDRNWPATKVEAQPPPEASSGRPSVTDPTPRERIRYLLARRLTREFRSGEAREYYPAAWQPKFDELVAALDQGWNEGGPAEQRARALFVAAYIARTNGMELLGTELTPDWFINGGNWEEGMSAASRSQEGKINKVNVATEEELERAAQHHSDPVARFHYRYQAAFLGWEAAKLLPDNSDETARVLCTAGSWLKARDPATADIFYKALVRRCRRTAIGSQADAMRWFPVLDANGQPKPYHPRLAAEETVESGAMPTSESTDPRSLQSFPSPQSPDEGMIENGNPAGNSPSAGGVYMVQAGDTLSSIAHAAGITVDQLMEANPDLDGSRLRIGQRLWIPEQPPESEPVEMPAQQ